MEITITKRGVMKKSITFLTCIFLVSLFGSNTVKGVGKDIQGVGNAITGSAEHVEESIKNNPPGSKMNESEAQ